LFEKCFLGIPFCLLVFTFSSLVNMHIHYKGAKTFQRVEALEEIL